eukprot:7116592-Pyramimonas_sp.AAC.1
MAPAAPASPNKDSMLFAICKAVSPEMRPPQFSVRFLSSTVASNTFELSNAWYCVISASSG